ncbi:hypothetical protein H6P81_002502 [Aristolochia fimbriata]|uniref:Phenazine biosynthesis PhzC/PhzF protein n=1 Tax=Aristolochia fimbriata TaxID=158543 RepID=A0AAV7FAH9_ARIFI|nr:hypothetical protein H6P81_002502 [Aristolochia fimbriata]
MFTPLAKTQLQRFYLRWFTPVVEIELCGHATLAAAHFLLTTGAVTANKIEFLTKSGTLTAKRVDALTKLEKSNISNGKMEEGFPIELDLPATMVSECGLEEIPPITKTLNGASIVNVKKTSGGDLIVELSSGKIISDIEPQLDEVRKWPERGIIITGPAPPESAFDIFSRFFAPNIGIDEDPVCGSAHCALAPYWSKKLHKKDLIAYMASPRGGRLDLHLDEDTQRVLIRGEAVTVMQDGINITDA